MGLGIAVRGCIYFYGISVQSNRLLLGLFNIVIQAEFAERGFGFVLFLLGHAAFGRHFNFHGQFQAARRCELGKNFRVKIHPFLRRNFAGPCQAGVALMMQRRWN